MLAAADHVLEHQPEGVLEFAGPFRHEAANLSRTNLNDMDWWCVHHLVHHASSGGAMNVGDLLGSGTISGEATSAMCCMTEMTAAGHNPLALPNGEERRWLQDGDELVFRARAERDGFVPVGFGECRGQILPAGA